MCVQAGFDALYFGRIDYQDREKRIGESDMEMLWRPSRSSEEEAQIFTGGVPHAAFYTWLTGRQQASSVRRQQFCVHSAAVYM